MKLAFCPVCGARLERRPGPGEGETPYCPVCAEYRFPLFDTAVSAVVLDAERRHMLLIRQYGEPEPVLVAGYVDKGETAEAAVVREIREELGMTASAPRFLGSHYYAPSETLMLNFAVTVREREARPNAEVEDWLWVETERAKALVKPGGLAELLLEDWEKEPMI